MHDPDEFTRLAFTETVPATLVARYGQEPAQRIAMFSLRAAIRFTCAPVPMPRNAAWCESSRSCVQPRRAPFTGDGETWSLDPWHY